MGVLRPGHRQQSGCRFRRVKNRIDAIAKDLRHAILNQRSACVGIAEQLEHALAPSRVAGRIILQLGDDCGILRIQGRAESVQDEQAVVDPLQAGETLKQRQHVVGERCRDRRRNPFLVVKHLPHHIIHRHQTEQARRVVRRRHRMWA
jgi:hypothetical protein